MVQELPRLPAVARRTSEVIDLEDIVAYIEQAALRQTCELSEQWVEALVVDQYKGSPPEGINPSRRFTVKAPSK